LFEWAHGIGGQKDLPISLDLAVAGAVAALVVSFTVLAVAWREPRYDAATSGRDAPPWLQRLVASRWFTGGLRAFGMVVFLYAAAAAVFGRDSLINPFFGIFYVWLWVGIVPMSVLFGPFWKAISPVRTINLLFAKVSGSDPDQGLVRYPERLGYWPAVVGLFAFVWLELVYPFMTDLGAVRLWCAAYVALMLLGGALFGSVFYEWADPFEVYSTLMSHLSVWGHRDGRLLVRSPLANLDAVVVRPGLVAVVGVLFGSTAFDSFRESPTFVAYVQGSSTDGDLIRNLALVLFCFGATAILAVGSSLTGVAEGTRRRTLTNAFAPSLIPIVFGYMIAHYLTYLVEVGSRTLVLASDPFSTGADYLGTGDWSDITWFAYHPTLLATIKVGAVVVGHVVGAIVAHDRALHLLPKRHQITGQLPMLAAMVAFTTGGLYLLFSS
jgi:hypothetical protein